MRPIDTVLSEVAQSCPTLCDPMDCSLPDSSVQGILQARILEWVAISFSRRFSQPRDQTLVSRIAGRFFTVSSLMKVQSPNHGTSREFQALDDILVTQFIHKIS